MLRRLVCLPLLLFAAPPPVFAQAPSAEPIRWAVDVAVGRASFVDSPPVPHSVVAGGARVYVTPRLAVGPELTVMPGPGRHQDTMITGNLTFDLVGPDGLGSASTAGRSGSALRVVPYIVAGGGWMQITSEVGTGLYTSSEGTFTAGGGIRIGPDRTWFIAPDFRMGWEPHWRATVVFGWRR